MKQEFTLNVCKTLITLTLICISLDVCASGNWTKIGTTAEGKPVMLSPTGQRFVSPHYEPFNGNYRGSATSTGLVVGSNGATSAMPVQATVKQTVSKPKVMAAILEKARTGGKALGRFAVGNSPYGRAFTLALLALEGSKYFWSDEEQDIVKKRDGNLYLLFRTNEANSIVSSMTKSQFDKWCSGTVTLSADYDSKKHGKVSRFCTDVSVVPEIKQSDLLAKCGAEKPGLNAHNVCLSNNILTGFAVKAVRIADDYVPITLDEFIDEATPEADSEPNEWVTTSEVEPDGEPTATVKGGTVAQTNPYTDPKDGKVKQTKWEFEDKDGDGDADGVRETTLERPDIPPNSSEAPELKPPTDSDAGDGTGTGDKDKPETASAPQPDLCEKNPDILACDKQPEKPEEDEFPEIPTEEVNLRFQPDSVFPNAGQCPAPVSFQAMGATYQISTQPICDVAEKLRPFIIALAYLAAAFFVIFTVKSETS